jgi:hypothetical protein
MMIVSGCSGRFGMQRIILPGWMNVLHHATHSSPLAEWRAWRGCRVININAAEAEKNQQFYRREKTDWGSLALRDAVYAVFPKRKASRSWSRRQVCQRFGTGFKTRIFRPMGV